MFFIKNTEFITNNKIPNKYGNFRKRSEETQIAIASVSVFEFFGIDFVSVFSVTVSISV
jgi:hypothetical protein